MGNQCRHSHQFSQILDRFEHRLCVHRRGRQELGTETLDLKPQGLVKYFLRISDAAISYQGEMLRSANERFKSLCKGCGNLTHIIYTPYPVVWPIPLSNTNDFTQNMMILIGDRKNITFSIFVYS